MAGLDIIAAAHCIQVIWPITDLRAGRDALIAEALPHLLAFAEHYDAVLVGEPVWRIRHGSQTLTWQHYDGGVLIGTVAVEHHPLRRWDGYHDIDEVKVARVVAGEVVPGLSRAERRAAIAALPDEPSSEVARRVGLSKDAVQRARVRLATASPARAREEAQSA